MGIDNTRDLTPMTDTTAADKTAAVIERVKKLLALAQGNANENEAASASAMAQKLMEDHNIDMAVLGKSGKGTQGARSDKKEKGGLYGWQRDLWKACAELNMCVYWSIKGLERGSVYEHRVLGSEVNVLATKLMAEYLEQTTNRLAQDKAKRDGYRSPFVRELIAYREGIASRLVERLRDLRRERIENDERKKREAAAAASHPSAAPGTSIVLADVIQSEDDLNTDYLHHLEPGTTAARRAERNHRMAMLANQQTLWAKGDREAFVAVYGEDTAKLYDAQAAREAKMAADWQLYLQGKDNETYGKPKKSRPSRSTGGGYCRERKKTAAEERASLGTYSEGRLKGNSVGLDPQVSRQNKERLS